MTALDAYAEYARYFVETMRLPSLPREAAARLIPDVDLDASTPATEDARRVLGTDTSGAALLEGFGRFVDATRNSYPGDTGPWEIAAVF